MYKNLMDEELVKLYREEGNQEAFNVLYARYKGFIYSQCAKFYADGYAREDFVQEGYAGLLEAIQNYKEEYKFNPFAMMVIKGSLVTGLKTATRRKHERLNNADRIERKIESEEGSREVIEYIPNHTAASPVSYIEKEEYIHELICRLEDTLTTLEKRSIELFMEEYTYVDIARELNESEKTIDNALHRARKKLRDIQYFITSRA